MYPNCSGYSKAVTLGSKIKEVAKFGRLGLGLFLADFWTFLTPQTLLRLPIYQFLILNFKPIHYHFTLLIEPSFRHHHPKIDTFESTAVLGVVNNDFTAFICFFMLTNFFFWPPEQLKKPTKIPYEYPIKITKSTLPSPIFCNLHLH